MQNLVAGGAGSPRRRNLRERAPVPEKKPAPLALGSSDEDDEDDEEEEEEDEGDEYNVSEEEEEEETTNSQKKEEQKRDKEKEKEKKKAGLSANRRAKAKANGKAKELAKPKGDNKKKTAALFHRACLKHLVPEDHCEVPERLSATIQVRLHPFLLVADYQCNQPSDTHTHHHTHHRTPLPQCIEELHDSEETQRQIELFASPSKADLRWVKVLPPWPDD